MEPDVTFRSDAFNTSRPGDSFINPDCYGDDVARWLICEMRARSVDVAQEPGQEDFGWFIRYRVRGVPHCLVLGLIPAEDAQAATWALWFERDVGLLGSLLGQRQRGVQPDAVHIVRGILESSPLVHEVEWTGRSG